MASRLSGFLGGVRIAANAMNPFNAWQARAGVSFEGAGQGRRMRNFQPSGAHINAALQSAGRTLVKRSRFLVENNGLAGNAVDTWVAWLIGDGIRPRIEGGDVAKRKRLMKLFHRWAKECDAEGMTNLYGLQERVEREAFIAGEAFVRFHSRRQREMRSVPLQLEVLPSEMLDMNYNEDLSGGNVIRMGIEFNALGRRVAYHFFRVHPDDTVTKLTSADMRVRVPAAQVLHVMDARQGGQIRGNSKFSRVMVPIFSLDIYDDAELERKKTAALYSVFVTKTGEAGPLDDEETDGVDEDGNDAIQMQPGAVIDLDQGEDIKVSQPADVGASYEPFEYRINLRISAGLGIPYAYLTGDCTKGNFSNVRTEIVNFRRKVNQRQQNITIPQLCGPIWQYWLDVVEAFGLAEVDEAWRDEDHGVPRQEWLDPVKDVTAEIAEVRAGFKNRSHSVAERGYDREEIDDGREVENAEADRRGFVFDTDPRRVTKVGSTNAVATGSGYLTPDNEVPDAQDVQDDATEAADKAAEQPAGGKGADQ